MSTHHLSGRSASELLWFQRRHTLQAAAAWVALGGWSASHAQTRSNIVELEGDVLLNGQRLEPAGSIQTGDVIQTGPQSRLVFVVGDSAFHVRQNSHMSVSRGASLHTVSMLRLLQGAVVGVWGKGSNRRILTPTVTATVRGAGTYTEIHANQDNRSYFCNCYGAVDVVTSADKRNLIAHHHQAVWADRHTETEVVLNPAQALNHTDEELEFLARLINQRTSWQIRGHKRTQEGEYSL